jgi:hypothetical protein
MSYVICRMSYVVCHMSYVLHLLLSFYTHLYTLYTLYTLYAIYILTIYILYTLYSVYIYIYIYTTYSDASIQLEGLKLLQIIAKTSQGWKQISAVNAGWQSICQGTLAGDALVHSLPGEFQNPGMCVCVYVCVCVCVCAPIPYLNPLYVCMSVCLYVCMSVCLYVTHTY